MVRGYSSMTKWWLTMADLHGTQEKRGSAPLSRGWHKISVEWFNKTGGADLNLRMGVLGDELQAIDPHSFSTSK